MNRNYIKMYRETTEWEWYKDPVVPRVFIHLLLMATYKRHTSGGYTYNRGWGLTTYAAIAKSLDITPRQARYACDRLESTGEMEFSKARNGLRYHVMNYDKYQGNDADDREPPVKKNEVPKKYKKQFGDDYDAYMAWRNQ